MPDWIQPLIDAIGANMAAHGPASPLGVRYRQLGDIWDLLVYPSPVEMIGGSHDGGRAFPPFSLDVESLLIFLSRVDSVTWDTHGCDPANDDVGPCIAILGQVGEHTIWLRVLANAPADVVPAVKVDATRKPTA